MNFFQKSKICDTIKEGFKFCAVIGTTLIIHNIITSVTSKNETIIKKGPMIIGEYVIADMICNKISDEAEKTWNNTINSFNKLK